jgi:hypothetical protein
VDRNYWVRTEHGLIWGPFTISALERLRGQLTEKCEASLDGKEWLPGADFPELRNLLAPARKIERAAASAPAGPRISRAIAEAFGIGDSAKPNEVPAAQPAAVPPPAAAAPPSPSRRPPVMYKAPDKLEVPDSGDLGRISPVRLYALTALTGASGGFRFQLEDGRKLQLVFRRGTPEYVASDDPDLGLVRFLQMKGVLPAEKALAAQEQAAKSGQDVLAVLFQLQLIPAADAHRLLGEHGSFLLDRAFSCWRGTFTFDKEAAPPPGSFPLGSRWGLLMDSVRRLEVPLLRARLGKRVSRPVVRSGGLAVGNVEELGLNAQETRIYAAIDGTRTGEQVLQAHESSTSLRLLYLLTELGHLGFADVADEREAAAPPSGTPPPADGAVAPPAQATKPSAAPLP